MLDLIQYAKDNKVAVLYVPRGTGEVTVAHSVLYETGRVTLTGSKSEGVRDGVQTALDKAVAGLGRGKALAVGGKFTSRQMAEREKFFREGKDLF
jgi:hypothetical protein